MMLTPHSSTSLVGVGGFDLTSPQMSMTKPWANRCCRGLCPSAPEFRPKRLTRSHSLRPDRLGGFPPLACLRMHSSEFPCGLRLMYVKPLLRRLLTRLLSLVPSIIVAVTVGRGGINTMLVASQVVLSVVLPFIIFPLVWLTSSRTVMRVRAPATTTETEKEDGAEEQQTFAMEEYLDFSNGWVIA